MAVAASLYSFVSYLVGSCEFLCRSHAKDYNALCACQHLPGGQEVVVWTRSGIVGHTNASAYTNRRAEDAKSTREIYISYNRSGIL